MVTAVNRSREAVVASFVNCDIEKAKDVLGFEFVDKGEGGYAIQTPEGKQFFKMKNNAKNRPFSLSLAQQYGEQMLAGQWAGQPNSPSKTCNGESWIIDKDGQVASCAHRACGLIIAEYQRQVLETYDHHEKLKQLGCDGPIRIPILLVTGVDPVSADTNDIGRTRSLGDVLYRRREFNGKKLSDAAVTRLSKELAVAVRLVWLRTHGDRVAGGAKLHHPEAIKFLEAHPLLHDAVEAVWSFDGGSGADGRKISKYITLGYAAGLLYLAATRQCNPKNKPPVRKPKDWQQAVDFWKNFSEENWGAAALEPIKSLHKAFENNRSSDQKFSRDALCVLTTRSFLAWAKADDYKGKFTTTRKLVSGLYVKGDGKEELDFIRFGGLDVSRDLLVEQGVVDDTVVERKTSGDWSLDDLCWVLQLDDETGEPDGEDPWYGKILEFSDDGKLAMVQYLGEGAAEDEKYQCSLSWLQVDEPESPNVEEEEEEEYAEV